MMSRAPRKFVFVCCGLSDGKIVSSTVEALTSTEALSLFEVQEKIQGTVAHGPFSRKKVIIKEENQAVIFNGESCNAIYNDWIVKALFTSEPKNCAYLLFDKRVDGKKAVKPAGTFIVKRDYLKDIVK